MLVQVIPPALRPKDDDDLRPRDVFYPDSDGEPMGETDWHVNVILYLRAVLAARYADRPDVYVAGNMLLYYQEGDPTERVEPDVFVVVGGERRMRRVYKLWEEPPPTVVFEITSRSTEMRDVGVKRGLYETMGVREYFLFDPLGEYLRPQLQGYRRGPTGDFVKLEPIADGALASEELGLELRPVGHELRLVDPATGETLLGPVDLAQARQEAEAKLADAEAELARLRSELARLRDRA